MQLAHACLAMIVGCGARAGLSVSDDARGVPDAAPLCPPDSPRVLAIDALYALAIDATHVYYSSSYESPVIRRVSKCGGESRTLASDVYIGSYLQVRDHFVYYTTSVLS